MNDRKYNVERNNEVSEKSRTEKCVLKHIDSLSAKMQEITVQLDSINSLLRVMEKAESRNIESVNHSLERIEKVGRQFVKAIK